MNPEKQMNLTMLCDYYELTMTNGYYACGMQNRITYFDIFFRSVPDGGGFAIAAGLEQAIRYIQQLHFDEDDIAYLRGRKMFSEGFLESLRNYRFTGDFWAVPEGAAILPDELYGVPAGGTMAHSWVQMFDSEYEAFKAYCEIYPDNPTLLVDTYNVLKSGVPNAIRVFNEVLKPRGLTKCGVRLDSGDMTYLTKKTRKMLDEAGWESCKISCSNALDEYLIQDLLNQGAQIDLFGVGERLITARSEPVFGGVYKLAAIEDENGNIIPKIKISENVGKITNPHFKKVYRFYGNDTGKAIADYICLHDEVVDDSRDLEIFDPQATWKRKNIYNFTAKELLVPIFKNGELVYDMPSLPDIQKYCAAQVDTLWDEVKRFDNPHTYYVDLSQKLWDIKYALLKTNGR